MDESTLYPYLPTGKGGNSKLEDNQRVICPWKWTCSPLQIMPDYDPETKTRSNVQSLICIGPSMTWDMVAIEGTNFLLAEIQHFLVANWSPWEITLLESPLPAKKPNLVSRIKQCSRKDSTPATILTDPCSPTSSRWSHIWLSASTSKRPQQCTHDNNYSTPPFPWDLSWCRTQNIGEPSSQSPPPQANQTTVNACQFSILIHNKVVNEAKFITDLALQRAVKAQGHWR